MKTKVLLTSNGEASGPAQAISKYLIDEGISVTIINHPLTSENEPEHLVQHFQNHVLEKEKIRGRPNRPPITYLFDILTPVVPPKSDVWISFSPLTTLQGLIWKKLRRTRKVVHWSVDFVPQRFGQKYLNRAYQEIDYIAIKNSDIRIDLSEAALKGREQLHRSRGKPALRNAGLVIPMGFWENGTPVTSEVFTGAKLVFLGHLVDRMGVRNLPTILELVKKDVPRVSLQIIGHGPLLDELKTEFESRGLSDSVIFHGFVKDHFEMTKLLSTADVAVAPYQVDEQNFTQFADPGKLKDYLGAGLPIVLTPVPPNWSELESAGVAVVSNDDAETFSAVLSNLLVDENRLLEMHKSILKYRSQFSWEKILSDLWRQISIDLA